MRRLIAIASVVAVVQGLAGRVPLAQKPTLFSRGSYFARRAREDAARAVRRALFGDQLSQLQVGGPRAIPDGGRVVVTGSTSGVGLDVAREVAALGYDVVVCGRDEKKLERAVALVGRVARRGVESARFDLESLTEVRQAAASPSGARTAWAVRGLLAHDPAFDHRGRARGGAPGQPPGALRHRDAASSRRGRRPRAAARAAGATAHAATLGGTACEAGRREMDAPGLRPAGGLRSRALGERAHARARCREPVRRRGPERNSAPRARTGSGFDGRRPVGRKKGQDAADGRRFGRPVAGRPSSRSAVGSSARSPSSRTRWRRR